MIDLEEEARDAWRPEHNQPRSKDVAAAVAALVLLPGLLALVAVGAYLAAVPR